MSFDKFCEKIRSLSERLPLGGTESVDGFGENGNLNLLIRKDDEWSQLIAIETRKNGEVMDYSGDIYWLDDTYDLEIEV